MKGRIFLTLFALPFFGVGVWMSWSVGSTLLAAYQMQGWVQTEAQLLSAGYDTSRGDDSATYKAFANFRYIYQGQEFVADRVSIGTGSDNIGDYQQDMGRKLSAAQSRGDSIPVFVNPDDPSEAIVDRGIRWGLMAFKSIFLFLFGGAGLGLLIAAWRTSPKKDKTDLKYANEPWLLEEDWQTPTMTSNSKTSMYAVWVFAAVWNLISVPLPFVMYDEVVNKQNHIALVGLLFNVIGVGLLIWAIRHTLEWRRFGPLPLTLDPFPGSIGGHVGGTIDLGIPFNSQDAFRLTLTNIHHYVSGSGKSRSQEEKAKWQDAVIAHAEPGGTGTRLTFRFDVPAELQPSDTERDDDYHAWRLNLSADLDGTDIDRGYDIPVYATATQSRHLSKLAIERTREKQHAITDKDILNVVQLRQNATGRSMLYPSGRHLGSSLGVVALSTVFAAVGWWLATAENRVIFGGVFVGIGALISMGALYVMSNSLQVSRDSDGISTVRRILGFPVKRRHLHFDAFAAFKKNSSLQTHGDGKHVMYYSIYAVDKQGDKIIVGEGFKGASAAAAAIRLIAHELGLEQQNTRLDRPDTGDTWDPAGLLSG